MSNEALRVLRIKRVEVNSFRGVAKRNVLDFCDSTGQPRSLILYGDNGSGKSTFVDALEFVLQGRIAQYRKAMELAEFAQSLASSDLPTAKVVFDDESSAKRTFEWDDEKLEPRLQGKIRGFGRAPLVLRRADILRFWDTPAEMRQLVFLDYGRPQNRPRELPQERIKRLEATRIRVKGERRQLLEDLERQLNLTIPINPEGFNKFVDSYVYGRRRGDPPGVRKRVPTAVQRKVVAIRDKAKEVKRLEKQLKEARHAFAKGQEAPPLELAVAYDEAAEELTDVFHFVTGNYAIKRLVLSHGELSTVGLSVTAHMANGNVTDPATVLSEANRDLVALLIFLTVARACARRGAAQVIILDDVFQSVDAAIRVAVMDYIFDRFAEWQLIITVHDRLWREQVRQLFQQHGHPVLDREIVRWSFEDGPVVRASQSDIDAPLREAIERAEPFGIAGAAGLLLEEICDTLSWTLPISIKRRRGDRYTLGELWPGVFKELRRSNAQNAAQEVQRYLHLRNLVGAHYNEWAHSVSLAELTRFGEAVLKLRSQVLCDNCGRWVERTLDNAAEWRCRCGATTIYRV